MLDGDVTTINVSSGEQFWFITIERWKPFEWSISKFTSCFDWIVINFMIMIAEYLARKGFSPYGDEHATTRNLLIRDVEWITRNVNQFMMKTWTTRFALWWGKIALIHGLDDKQSLKYTNNSTWMIYSSDLLLIKGSLYTLYATGYMINIINLQNKLNPALNSLAKLRGDR